MIVYEDVFNYKNKVFVREFDTETKEVFFKKETVIPRLFTKGDGEYNSFVGNFPLKEIKNKSYSDFREALSSYKKSGVMTYGRKNPSFEYIYNNYPNPLDCVHQFRTWFLDIEVTGEIDSDCQNTKLAWKPEFANQEVTLIQYFDSFEKKYYVLGLKELEKPLEVTEYPVKYVKFSSEENLLKGFLKLLECRKPSIIIGWNTFGYDFPYLTNRIARVLDGFRGDLFEDGKIQEDVLYGGYVKSLSPFGIVEADYKVINSNEEFSPNWKGIILEDYLHLYKKYTFVELASFSLNSVCSHELGDEKVDHDEYSDFMEFYQKDFQKFCEYGVKDVELLVKLDEKLKLLMLVQYISYMTGVCIPDVRGTLKQWSNYVYNEAFKQKIVVPTECVFTGQSEVKFIGGVVHSTSNIWNWVASLDFTSLYPSTISCFNIGADTWVKPNPELLELKEKYFLTYSKEEETKDIKKKHIDFCNNILFNEQAREEIHSTLEKYNVTATPNGQFFTKEKRSLIAVLLDNLLVERKRYKKLMKEAEQKVEDLKAKEEDYHDWKSKAEAYEVTQVALKVLANSLYGVLSMASNPFAGHPEYFSNAVTSSGQIADLSCALSAGKTISKINNKLDKGNQYKTLSNIPFVATMDTDSYYLCVEPFVKYKCQEDDLPNTVEKVDQFLKKVIQPQMRDHLDNCYSYCFNTLIPEKMNLDREIIADRFFSVGDKNYYTRIWDNEGVRLTKPKIKTVGIAVKKANCPKFFRETVLESMILLLDEKYKEIRALKAKYEEEIREADILDICISVNINSLDYQPDESGKLYSFKDGKKLPAPINSRAGIVYNNFIEKYNIPLPPLEIGKAHYVFLKEPNPCKSNVIAFKDPKIFEYKNLKDYIDYDIIFEKFYVGLLNLIAEPLNLTIWEEDSSLDIDEW